MATGVALDIVDNGNGSVTVAWPQFPGASPNSYNVYVNGVLNQNVATRKATISGLQTASYNGLTKTPALTYDIKVVAVVAGNEVLMAMDRLVTVSPTSAMLQTPMKRDVPFGNVLS